MFQEYISDSNDDCATRTTPFKKCPRCGVKWDLREAFLGDPAIELIGYQTNFRELSEGLFYFNHACEGTFTLYASDFQGLYDGPIFTERRQYTEDCPNYCLYKNNLRPCPVHCECAYVREILQIIKNWPKQQTDPHT